MAGLERYGATPNYNDSSQRQRLGNDEVYGPGFDGTVIISSNTSLTKDMYYNNLTVNNGVTLNANGYRIFVKGTLTLNGTITNTGTTTNTISAISALGSGNLTGSIGGNSGGNTFTTSKLNDGQRNDLLSIINGRVVLSDGTTQVVTGGAAGNNGSPGTVTPAGAGGAGSLDRNPLVPGGPGTPGTNVPAASGGSGGTGGGVVVLVAKSILGSGSVSTTGANATSGESSATGSAGSAAPNATLSHSVDGSAHYITGNGSTGPHATTPTPNLPHGGHVPYAENYRHGYTYHHVHRGNVHHSGCSGDCHSLCGGASTGHYNHGHNHAGGDYAHHSGDYNNSSHIDSPSLYPTYFAINGIDHTPGHRGNIGEARIGHNSHTSGYFHVGHDAPHHSSHNGGHGGKLPCGAYHNNYAYPRHHWQQNHGTYIFRNAGSVSSAGSVSKSGGTAGTAGSTTAGGNGITGGGGGIIIVTDSISNSITTSVTGGTGGTGNGSSGSVITILNI